MTDVVRDATYLDRDNLTESERGIKYAEMLREHITANPHVIEPASGLTRGVLVLLSDSTNAEQAGPTRSEASLNDAFHQIMRRASERVIVATFASLISRIQQVIDVAREYNRKVAIAGRSMVENTVVPTPSSTRKMPRCWPCVGSWARKL